MHVGYGNSFLCVQAYRAQTGFHQSLLSASARRSQNMLLLLSFFLFLFFLHQMTLSRPWIYIWLRSVHVIPCYTHNGRVSFTRDLDTLFQVMTRWEKYNEIMLLGPERNLIHFIKLWGDLVKTLATWVDAEICWLRVNFMYKAQFHSSCWVLKWHSCQRCPGAFFFQCIKTDTVNLPVA